MSNSMCQDHPYSEIDHSIDDGYSDGFGNWHDTTDEARRAIAESMRSQRDDENSSDVLVILEGESCSIDGVFDLTFEDGSTTTIESSLPSDLPLGYHFLSSRDSDRTTHLIVAPSECYFPETLRVWGWSAQLYAIRSAKSWGMGDFSDLARLATISKNQGAGVVQVNPLGAASPSLSQVDSPYYPTSRRFLNPLYIDVQKLAAGSGVDVSEQANHALALNDQRQIDRDEVFRQKFAAFEKIYDVFVADADFDAFCDECATMLGRSTLQSFATFCALAELYGGDYRSWPEEFQSPKSQALVPFASEHSERVRFFKWLQWHADRQLMQAAQQIEIAMDLPIGFDPGGFDAWEWQDVIASGVAIGAPPDAFNVSGQNWAIPPFVPNKLREVGYRPFVETIRANLRHAGGLRIDHVMGLYRLFWIPEDMQPVDGTYVQYRSNEMLAILAIESQRAKAWVAGEDLGTVPSGMREQMSQMNILSHRLAIFEQSKPEDFPTKTLAAISTHDLPTLAGLWTGSDIQAVREMGREPNETDYEYMLDCLRRMTNSSPDETADEVIRRAYATLTQAPSAIVLASLEDAIGVEQRPNMPGTIDEWPNWRLALPTSLEQIESSQRVAEFAAAIRR